MKQAFYPLHKDIKLDGFIRVFTWTFN